MHDEEDGACKYDLRDTFYRLPGRHEEVKPAKKMGSLTRRSLGDGCSSCDSVLRRKVKRVWWRWERRFAIGEWVAVEEMR